MPRYYFNLRQNGELRADAEGLEFENFAEMRREAVLSARELIAEALKAGDNAVGRAFEVTDDSGAMVLRLAFTDVLSEKA